MQSDWFPIFRAGEGERRFGYFDAPGVSQSATEPMFGIVESRRA
jgi:hypothetical protein